MSAFIVFLFQRLTGALTTLPSRQDWVYALQVFCVFAAVIVPLGFLTGFLRWQISTLPLGQQIFIGVAAFFTPALAEEIVFRAMLLPHPKESRGNVSPSVVAWFGLILFVAYHPVKALLFNLHPVLFTDPAFLAGAAALGGACTLVYRRSGSIWPPALLHWVAVVGWLTLFGGYAKLFTAP